jgi:electron transfer flavoprotein alpha subunit
MERVLFLAHTERKGLLSKASLEALAAAGRLAREIPGSSLAAGLIGEDLREAAGAIAGCGASAFFGVSGAEFGVSRYATDAAAAEALVRRSEATLVVAAATSRLARSLPGVAPRVGGRIDTKITGFCVDAGVLRVERWFYRQRMSGNVTRRARPWFLLLAPGVEPPWSGAPGPVDVAPVEVPLSGDLLRTRVTGQRAASSGAQTIRPDAALLLVAGAGWTKKQSDGRVKIDDAARLILEFLDRTQASLGSSKSLVDQVGEGHTVLPFMSHLNQVGQTGATPRHPKGLATCCHGEEPHVVGWRFVNERRAVNLDPGCGWARGKADVLYVADAFQVMERVNELLAER